MSLDEPQKNKMMQTPPAKKEFHFSGEGIWHNLTILAEHIEDATEQWLAKRQLINPPPEPVEQSTPPPVQEQQEKEL